MIQRRIFDGPDPASPLNKGEPLKTMAIFEPSPPFSGGKCILEIMCCKNRNEPSLMAGNPAPNRPAKPSALYIFTTHRLRACKALAFSDQGIVSKGGFAVLR
jgi:hypothetical protein